MSRDEKQGKYILEVCMNDGTWFPSARPNRSGSKRRLEREGLRRTKLNKMPYRVRHVMEIPGPSNY